MRVPPKFVEAIHTLSATGNVSHNRPMHTATQLVRESFQVQIDGRPAPLDQLTPNWNAHDRFGIVVRQPLGGLGASLLIQLGIANFYAERPQRRSTRPEYPEIYLFHVGGLHGDYSAFDFWPPRKEILCPGDRPVALLEAINSHAITRLALPDGLAGDVDRLAEGPSTWAEQSSAIDRIASCFVYGPDGRVAGADVVLSCSDLHAEENVDGTFDLRAGANAAVAFAHAGAALAGPSIPADVYRWADAVKARLPEVPDATHDTVARGRAALLSAHGGRPAETYRRISVEAALELIAGC